MERVTTAGNEMDTAAALIRRLPEAFSKAQARTVADRLLHSTEAVNAVRVEPNGRALHVTLVEERSRAEVTSLIEEIAAEVARSRMTAQRVIRRSGGAGDAERASATEPAPLPPVVTDRATAKAVLRRAFDLMFLDLARSVQAAERSYPPLIRREAMERCNYLATFPQNAYLVSEFPHDRRRLEAVRSGRDLFDNSRLSEYMLNPAQCFHCYTELAGSHLTDLRILTMHGDCFRHEVPWRVTGHRLPGFSMREIVFLGVPDEVEELRNSLMDRVWQAFLTMGFQGRLETATDPFYFSEDSALQQFQLMAAVKYELVAQTPTGESYAVASFNNIRDSLCRKFDVIHADGHPAHSGCAAFGIERWAEATLAQFGESPEQWPRNIVRFCR